MGRRFLVVSGTNRPGSNASKIASVLQSCYQAAGATAEIYRLDAMPPEVLAPASYASKPASFAAVQQAVFDADGLHLVVPEYNGSFPGVLKLWIDMLKFPESFERKPVAFVGESAGAWGGLRAVEQLQMVFGYRNAHAFPDRVFIPQVHQKLDDHGAFADADLRQRLERQVRGFVEFVGKLKA